jgi:ribosomal protein L37E
MGLIKRFLRRQEDEETKCPRCGTPAPAGTIDCSACGWDFREQFRGVTGSHLATVESGSEPAARVGD